MSYMSKAEFAPAYGIHELDLNEIDLINGAGALGDFGNIAMATGAVIGAGGVLIGNPAVVAGGAIVGGVGGIAFLLDVALH